MVPTESDDEILPLPPVEESQRTLVVNVKSGARYDVLIGRPSPFGNPYRTDYATGRTKAIEAFRVYFLKRLDESPEFRALVLALRGKTLGCHCKPRPCHGDVIAEWLDANP
jgi:hypothetical protein